MYLLSWQHQFVMPLWSWLLIPLDQSILYNERNISQWFWISPQVGLNVRKWFCSYMLPICFVPNLQAQHREQMGVSVYLKKFSSLKLEQHLCRGWGEGWFWAVGHNVRCQPGSSQAVSRHWPSGAAHHWEAGRVDWGTADFCLVHGYIEKELANITVGLSLGKDCLYPFRVHFSVTTHSLLCLQEVTG